MEDLLNAARLGDPLSHTAAMYGFWAGLAIGLLVAVAIIGTGGLAAPAIIGAVLLLGAAVGGLLGESIGSMDASRAVTGAITSGSPNVFINDKSAARAHIDKGSCNRDSPVPQIIAQGSCSVFINGMHAARKSDAMTCGALINDGSPNVFIGGDKFTTDAISPEVPTWLNNTLMVVAMAGATILLGPAVAILGLTFSVIGGEGGKALSHLCGFKKGSDGEKWFQIAGSILGGAAGGKLGGGLPRGVVVADEVVPPENEIIPEEPLVEQLDNDDLDFTNRVQDEASDIIKSSDGLKRGIAYAKARVNSLNRESEGFKNISLRDGTRYIITPEFPGVEAVDGGSSFKIVNQDEFMDGIKKAYEQNEQELNPTTKQNIIDYISSKDSFETKAGVPGLHAEVQAINDIYNNLPDLVNPSDIANNPGDLKVATYKIQRTNAKADIQQGDAFPACSNCSGILPKSVKVITGRINK